MLLWVSVKYSHFFLMAVKVNLPFFNLRLIMSNTILKIGLTLSIFKFDLKYSTFYDMVLIMIIRAIIYFLSTLMHSISFNLWFLWESLETTSILVLLLSCFSTHTVTQFLRFTDVSDASYLFTKGSKIHSKRI